MRTRRCQRGASFVMALGFLTVMVTAVVGAVASARTFAIARINRVEARDARLAAESGIEYAMGILASTQAGDPTVSPVTSLLDEWATTGQQGEDEFVIGTQRFRLEIRDASSFINLNTATEEQLRRLPMTNEQIDSLLDWREADLTPRPEGGKDEFYNNLANPYNTRLARFETVEELLSVKGFSPMALFFPQEDISLGTPLVSGNADAQPSLIDLFITDSSAPNTTATGETKYNAQNVNVGQMVGRGIPPPIAQRVIDARNALGTVTSVGRLCQMAGFQPADAIAVVDNISNSGASVLLGRINLNTATEAVLNSVPGMTPDLTSAILSRQQSGGFNSLGELLTLPGFTVESFETVDYFATSSQLFLVRTIGRSGRSTVALEAIVAFRDGRPVVTKMKEPSYTDVAQRWAWSPEPSATIPLYEVSN